MGLTRELYQWPGVAETVDFAHIKGHYYASHATINPTGIVPKGPLLDFTRAHGRDALRAVPRSSTNAQAGRGLVRRVFTTPDRKELTAAYDAWAVRY